MKNEKNKQVVGITPSIKMFCEHLYIGWLDYSEVDQPVHKYPGLYCAITNDSCVGYSDVQYRTDESRLEGEIDDGEMKKCPSLKEKIAKAGIIQVSKEEGGIEKITMTPETRILYGELTHC